MAISDKQLLKNQDLVLKVSTNVDPAKFDMINYEDFLDALCGDREYQKEAIRETLRFLLGGQYNNLRDLAKDNYQQNPVLRDLYSTLEDFYKHLQLPDKLSCSLDLATATGKSYVIYGIARIMLAEGAVDQILVLCPSNTIERGLTDKFRSLSADRTLKELLSDSAVISNPRIINASQTIQKGDICIENIHATYERTKSAIEDSLVGKGERTLVLNDEAHHMANPPARDQALKKWKEFLLDPKYNFRYIVGDSGTCYVGNDYFTDVIYRFSLKQSIEERFVKTIDYVAQDISHTKEEKFQKIYDNHIENKTVKHRLIKPITILVTKDIAACKRLTEDLIHFLSDKENISRDAASRMVLIVTSANEHKNNIPKLKDVDSKGNQVEWITSVSMLSEGWDVQNVCQIVPHEERAFNSKLLIAQVLGRGLRIPPEYKGEQPTVTVFNHDKWSSSIRGLVNEVLEIEKKLYSYSVAKERDYNFKLYNITYEKSPEVVETPQVKQYDFVKDFSLASQAPQVEEETTYERVVTEQRRTKKTLIEHRMYSAEEVAQDVLNRLKAYDLEEGTAYSKKYSFQEILTIIRNSLKGIGEKKELVSQDNRQRFLKGFGVIKRKGSKSLRYKTEAEHLFTVMTENIDRRPLGIGALKGDSTIFYDEISFNLGDDKDKKLLGEVIQMFEDGELRSASLIKIDNIYNFKTPLNTVFASYKPERDFIRKLVNAENAKIIDAWIKSLDTGFYGIEYSWRKGEHPKQGSFNPDFFIKVNTNDILVVEIKEDGDISPENKAKLKYAREHFDRVNHLQSEHRYYFKFLSPQSYDIFFQKLREGEYQEFKSSLEADLDSNQGS